MYCPRCGERNEDSARFCSACGKALTISRPPWTGPATIPPPAPYRPLAQQPPAPQQTVALPVEPSPSIPTYLGWAAVILTCCWPAWPAGVAAMVFAIRTESRLEAGDLAAAQAYSHKAKTWCWITFAAGLVLWLISFSLIIALC